MVKRKLRIAFFGNNWLAWQLVKWLRGEGEEIVGLIVHPKRRRRYGEELIREAGVGEGQLFDGSELRDPETVQALKRLRPDIGISTLFGYILRKDVLDLMPLGCINVHPSFLPYNRGAYPNVWSIVDHTPAGASLHYMDEGVDTGDLIARREEVVEPTDTGETLYHRLERAATELFADTWPLIRAGRAARIPQPSEGGTHHRVRDVECIDEIDLRRSYTAQELIDVIRARTFSPFRGAYFLHGGRKVYLRLELAYDEAAGDAERDDSEPF